jgi:hypothetical protein
VISYNNMEKSRSSQDLPRLDLHLVLEFCVDFRAPSLGHVKAVGRGVPMDTPSSSFTHLDRSPKSLSDDGDQVTGDPNRKA